MGAKGFMNDWDHLIERPSKRLSPPKFIQFRYNIGKSRINIITYLTFLADFADRMLALIQAYTQVDPYRIYMQFTEMPRDGAWKYIPKP